MGREVGVRRVGSFFIWTGFFMFLLYRDINGIVNGFYTGFSVYLIICRIVRGEGGFRFRGSSVLGSG